MNLLKKLSSLSVLSCVFASCGMVGEDPVTIPAYIYIPSFTFITDTSSFNTDIYQGTNSQRITDMWISDAGKLIANVGLPSLIPVQKTGPTQVWVEAGIIISGQDEQRQSYPLMSQYIVPTLNLRPGEIDTIRPVFRYLPNIDFKFIEDYDRPGSFLNIQASSKLPGDSVIKVNDQNAWKPGKYSGKIQIDPNHQGVLLLSDEYLLPRSGSPVYLEIDYKSNLTLDIGYYYQDPSGATSTANSVIQTYPTNSEWKKLYVRLTDEVASRKDGTLYKVYIAVFNTDNTVVPEVYLDNVKLVCLKG
jgi:hypothetical protein